MGVAGGVEIRHDRRHVAPQPRRENRGEELADLFGMVHVGGQLAAAHLLVRRPFSVGKPYLRRGAGCRARLFKYASLRMRASVTHAVD